MGEIFLIACNCVVRMKSMKIFLLFSKYISLMNSEAILSKTMMTCFYPDIDTTV